MMRYLKVKNKFLIKDFLKLLSILFGGKTNESHFTLPKVS